MKKYTNSNHKSATCPVGGAEEGEKERESGATGRISCSMAADNPDNPKIKPAITFLKANGQHSLVSLGCGSQPNRIDNHLRLLTGLDLDYYVGIDCVPDIEPVSDKLFMDTDGTTAHLNEHYNGQSRRFLKGVRLFPGTFVQELAGVHCAVVVCQRVYPDCFWEEVIISMNPLLVLQEDLHGCERQKLRGRKYVRSWSKIRRYGLRSFRPWPIFPGEKNLVLWRRRDFGGEKEAGDKFQWLERLAERFIG
ncbi:hypothetical protein ACFL03_13305 [Thermodesulfobacteriota bacterium]